MTTYRIVILTIVATLLFVGYVDFLRFPEMYCPKLKYHLKLDMENGDIDAIEYYNKNYISNNRFLYD